MDVRTVINEMVAKYHLRKKYMKWNYSKYLVKLLILDKITPEMMDRELGKYYEYPQCCIDFYVYLLSKGLPPAMYCRDKLGYEDHSMKQVPCPTCYAKWSASSKLIQKGKENYGNRIQSCIR